MIRKLKWKIARKKVLDRYYKLITNFPEPPVCGVNEDFSDYTNRTLKHIALLGRVQRLHRIFQKHYSYLL